MQIINTSDGLFRDGNPASGEPGTIVPAAWLNSMQSELLSVLSANGITPDPAKTTQLLDAVKKLAWNSTSARPSTLAGYGITDAAPLNSPVLTGVPTAPTVATGDNSTKLATTAFVQSTALLTAPPGQAAFFFMATPPAGWLKANGAAISRTAYAALFAAIGTTYGIGDGLTTFNLPDLRGEFVRGWDDGRGVNAYPSARVFGSWEDASSIATYAHADAAPAGALGAITNITVNPDGSGANLGIPNANYNMQAASVINGGSIYAGTSKIRPRNIALLACIKY